MPILSIADSDQDCFLISFDENGVERTDDPAGQMSDRVVEELRRPISDVFIFCHGWMGDVASAQSLYSTWFASLYADAAGPQLMRERHGSFTPLLVGLHWPSKPFGDEQFAGGGQAFAATTSSGPALTVEGLTTAYRDRFADPERAEPALRTIFEHMRHDAAPYDLTDELRVAFNELNAAMSVGAAASEEARPGDDREQFDPDTLYYEVSDEASFGQFGGGLLTAVGTLSFWQMKARAAAIGETGANDLLRRLVAARPAARFHLVGHSFGCIVVSAMLASRTGVGLPASVHSAALVQGALSCWAYCAELPKEPSRAGYFNAVVRDGLVRGPLLTFRSLADRAVGWLYPIAAGVRGQYAFDVLVPQKYSALGSFGAQQVGAHDLPLGALNEGYTFAPGQIYNLDSTTFVKKGGFVEGGHNDIFHPELGHAIWAAAATVV